VVAVGVDACRGGWVAVVLGDRPATHVVPEIGAVAAILTGPAAIAIDIPIGLPVTGCRRADVEAKAVLGARRSTIFTTPVRAALAAPTHAEATAISRRRCGFGISQQAFALRHRIFEVEGWLPDAPGDVREVHPEVSFAVLTGRPAEFSKHTAAGLAERRAALLESGIDVDPVLRGAAEHDVLDAALVAWTAQRMLDGRAHPIPDPPETCDRGRPAAIWV
jgi:predicted RNase H-like nuclease